MEFSIRGIGIIKEADIKMDGLTVIAGSNNSGKTTVGRALYSVVNAVADLEEKQAKDQAEAVVYRIRKIVEPIREWLSIYNTQMEKEEDPDEFVEEIEKLCWTRMAQKNLDYYIGMFFRLCESLENGSLIAGFADNFNKRYKEGNLKYAVLNDWEAKKEKVLKECENAREFVESLQKQSKKEFACKIIEKTLQVEFADQIQSFICLDQGEVSSLSFSGEEKKCYDICIAENKVLAEKSNFTDGYYDRTYFVDDPYIMEDPVYFDGRKQSTTEENSVQIRIMPHRENMRRVMRNTPPERGISEAIYQEKELEKVLNKINEIVPGKVSQDVYQTATGTKLKVGNLATGSKIFSIIKKILMSGDLSDKTLLILDEPESHLHPSWINQLAEVIVLLVKECNITVLLTTHSPNFLLAIDALMRKYRIEEKCHFYQTEPEEDNRIKYVEKTDSLDNIYADFAASFAEMNALRKKYMNLEE